MIKKDYLFSAQRELSSWGYYMSNEKGHAGPLPVVSAGAVVESISGSKGKETYIPEHIQIIEDIVSTMPQDLADILRKLYVVSNKKKRVRMYTLSRMQQDMKKHGIIWVAAVLNHLEINALQKVNSL